jgi:DNA polymerase III sliding clamp (beta) subunit (PCNA family)
MICLKYGRFSAQVGCVDVNSLRKEPNHPKMALNNEFSLPGKYLDEICHMVSSSGKIRLFVENKVIMLRAEEGDLSVTEVAGTTDGKGEVNSLYSAANLKDIAKAVKGVDCTVRAGIDHPVHIFAEIEDCNFQFLLAPRIESD